MNLLKQLQKTAKENYQRQMQDAEMHLESVKANLIAQDQADSAMLEFFGTKKVVAEQTAKVSAISKFIKNDFVTKDDIKKVCIRYNLRFLNSRYYKKEIPLAVLSDLRKFQELKKLSNYDCSKNLYVIAPSNHFELGPRPAKDPILLYAEGDDNYTIISTWGSDFNLLRRVNGFIACIKPALPFIILALIVFVLYLIVDAAEVWLILLLSLPFAPPVFGEVDTPKDYWDKPHK